MPGFSSLAPFLHLMARCVQWAYVRWSLMELYRMRVHVLTGYDATRKQLIYKHITLGSCMLQHINNASDLV